jgi:hypothetical protein
MGTSRRLAAAVAGLALAAAASGCGSSDRSPAISGTNVAAICAQTAARLAAIGHRRIVRRGSSNVIVAPSKQAREHQKDVEAALSEDAAVYAAAIPALERLRPATSAGSVALEHLEETARRVETLRREFANRGSEGGLGLFFAVGEASGGCRKVRAAIGG